MVANDERFPGPAALNRLFTVATDSRDAGHADRAAVLVSEDTLDALPQPGQLHRRLPDGDLADRVHPGAAAPRGARAARLTAGP